MTVSPTRSSHHPHIYEADDCRICLDNFESDNQCLLLKCGHIFHKKCLEDWNHKAAGEDCPLCRTRFTILPTKLEVLSETIRKSAYVTGVLFLWMGSSIASIAGAIGIGYVLKSLPSLVAYMRLQLDLHEPIGRLIDSRSSFTSACTDAMVRFLASIGTHLTSGTTVDPQYLKNHPPLISSSKDFAIALLILGAIAMTITTTTFLIINYSHQFSTRDRNARHIRYSGTRTSATSGP